MELITTFNLERNLTVLMVTHEQDMAAYAKRRVHFLDGQIVPEPKPGGHS